MASAPTASDGSKLAAQAADPEANPISLAQALDAATGREWRDWLPETLGDFVGLGDDDVQQRDKLLAAQAVASNPDAFHDWGLFLSCVIAFNHRRVNFDWLDKPTIAELAWGCTVMNQINSQETFGDGVLRFIGSAMILEGLVFFPWTGGDGLALSDDAQKWAHGLVDHESVKKLADQVRAHWAYGKLRDLELSEVDHENALHTQLADIVRAQTYIKAQKP